MQYSVIIAAVLALGGLGVLFAVGIAIANAKLAVKKDPLAEQILAALPGVNCGACGYAGCAGYADAVAAGKVPPDACIPGGGEAAKRVAAIIGGEVRERAKRFAIVRCNRENVKESVDYQGLKDCKAATLLTDSIYECAYACLGLGTCQRACPFGAIVMSEGKLPIVLEDKCTGCGLCARACPKGLITVDKESSRVHILCSSRDKGAVCRKLCSRSCIACGRCAKVCPASAIEVSDFLAKIDYSKCTSCEKCVTVCPTGAIGDFSQMRRREKDAA